MTHENGRITRFPIERFFILAAARLFLFISSVTLAALTLPARLHRKVGKLRHGQQAWPAQNPRSRWISSPAGPPAPLRPGRTAAQSCVCFLALNPEWKCHEDNHHGDISAAPYRAMREMFFFFKSLLKMEWQKQFSAWNLFWEVFMDFLKGKCSQQRKFEVLGVVRVSFLF